MTAPFDLTVMLVNPKVVVAPGEAVTAQLVVIAPTESVILSVDALPEGVIATYSATESNPSGSLRFKASTAAITGSYMPRVTVMSSGRSASQVFQLVVQASAKP